MKIFRSPEKKTLNRSILKSKGKNYLTKMSPCRKQLAKLEKNKTNSQVMLHISAESVKKGHF